MALTDSERQITVLSDFLERIKVPDQAQVFRSTFESAGGYWDLDSIKNNPIKTSKEESIRKSI